MKLKKTILIISIILILLLAACRQRDEGLPPAVTEEPAADAPAEVENTPRPTTAPPAGTTVLADGRLVAANPALPLGFNASGQLLSIEVDVGDTVQSGQLLAILEAGGLNDALASAELQISQAEISLEQARLSLDNLLNWEPDELAVELAEANLAVAQANLESAEAQDAAAGNSLTSARVNVDQAQRAVEDAQDAYDTAWDPARDWELGDPYRKLLLEAEREATARGLQQAEEALSVARANYNLTLAGLNNNSALNAQAAVINARQALEAAQTGPKAADIAAAELQVDQAEISLEQAQLNLVQAQQALQDASLYAPWSGTVLSVDSVVGSLVGPGTPIVTLLDTEQIRFHTSNLSERDLGQVAAGQPAEITLKAYPARPLSGRVVLIMPQASGQLGDAATFTVVIVLDNSELELLSGMTGRVEISAQGDN